MSVEFPGNVRQLENICHWLTVMAPAQVVEPKDLPPELLGGAPMSTPATPAAAAAPADPGAASASPVSAIDPVAVAAAAMPAQAPSTSWLADLEREARTLLESGSPEVWDALTRQFEGQLIHTALEVTRGRRIEAAQKLGIGRNTITRKIQELGLDE
jgi:two-component system nitrogen regulation response regulator GlnG